MLHLAHLRLTHLAQTAGELPTMDEVARNWTFKSDTLISPSLGLTLLAIVAGLVAILALIKRHRERRHIDAPLKVFRDIARQLGLAPRDQTLLIRIARQQALPSPITLLASPDTLDYHAKRFGQSLPRPARKRALKHTQNLRHQLFNNKPSEPRP